MESFCRLDLHRFSQCSVALGSDRVTLQKQMRLTGGFIRVRVLGQPMTRYQCPRCWPGAIRPGGLCGRHARIAKDEHRQHMFEIIRKAKIEIPDPLPFGGDMRPAFCTVHGSLRDHTCPCDELPNRSRFIQPMTTIHWAVHYKDGAVAAYGCYPCKQIAEAAGKRIAGEDPNPRASYRWSRALKFPVTRYIEKVTCINCLAMIEKAVKENKEE